MPHIFSTVQFVLFPVLYCILLLHLFFDGQEPDEDGGQDEDEDNDDLYDPSLRDPDGNGSQLVLAAWSSRQWNSWQPGMIYC